MPTLPVGPHTSIISSGLARNSLNDSLDTPLCPSTLATNALTGILSCIGASMPAESDADPLSVLTLAGLARKDSMRTTGFTLEEVQSYAKTYLGVENLMPPQLFLTDAGDAYTLPGRGGTWYYFLVTKVSGNRASSAVTVQFFADPTYLVPSHLVRYQM